MYDNNNIFAKILRKELPATIVYEDDCIVAIKDINPAAPVHVLAVSKKPYISFDDFADDTTADTEISNFFRSVRLTIRKLGLSGYRLVSNHGKDGGQIIPHFHIHILGGKELKGF